MKNQQCGYTLMELLVVLAIVGVLGGVALPPFSKQIQESRLSSTVYQLHSVFKFARSEAVKREKTMNLVIDGQNWVVKMDGQTLMTFEPNHSTISVIGLSAMNISATGETTSEHFTISDNDVNTADYSLCIYRSGQSKNQKGSVCS